MDGSFPASPRHFKSPSGRKDVVTGWRNMGMRLRSYGNLRFEVGGIPTSRAIVLDFSIRARILRFTRRHRVMERRLGLIVQRSRSVVGRIDAVVDYI